MGKTTKTFITTDDTSQTYEMDGVYRPETQLWLAEVKIVAIDSSGCQSRSMSFPKEFYVERSTIEKLGLVPYKHSDEPATKEEKQDNVKEALEKLLSLVGVYPEE